MATVNTANLEQDPAVILIINAFGDLVSGMPNIHDWKGGLGLSERTERRRLAEVGVQGYDMTSRVGSAIFFWTASAR